MRLLVREKTFCGMVCKTLMFWDYGLYEKLLEEERAKTESVSVAATAMF